MRKLLVLLPALISLGINPGAASAAICTIKAFLDDCPTLDPAYSEIRNDFVLRRDGQLIGDVACQEPVSQLPIDEYTDELIVLQSLRVIYYLDRGQPGQLPWTAGTFYQWLKQKIGGINIVSTGDDRCCFLLSDDRLYFNVRAKSESSRDFLRQFRGIATFIALMAHERRHLDGAFAHLDCCPAGRDACDQSYDVANLSPYGVHWWIERAFIDGTLYTGYSCLTAQEIKDTKDYLRSGADGHRDNFCDNMPPLLTDVNNPVAECDRFCWARNLRSGDWWLRTTIWLVLAGLVVSAAIVSLRYVRARK